MFNYDEEALIEEAKRHCEEFLRKNQRQLATFTGDSSLMYIPDPLLTKFKFNPSKGALYLPLASFVDMEADENQIMWHIYYELALYPDWKKEPRKYLNREEEWKIEIDHMTGYILSKIKMKGLDSDPAYDTKIIKNYVKKEVTNLLFIIDKYTAYLRVLQLCPVYRDEENFIKVRGYIDKLSRIEEEGGKLPRHRIFSNSLLSQSQQADEVFNQKIFNKPLHEFINIQLTRQINNDDGIIERTMFVRSFIYPIFEELWKSEIDEMEFYKSSGEGGALEQSKLNDRSDSIESTPDDINVVLEEILDLEEQTTAGIQSIIEGKLNLESYGISQSDQELFKHYSDMMKQEREQMSKFWRKLIGDMKKEINVKKDRQTKGKLDIDNFIKEYPNFVEAEKKGNYKNLQIFNRYLLEAQAGMLPERIEISFLIDNSGSMNKSKIEAARKALAVTLLSIDDFNSYLKGSVSKLNQKIDVLTETWFFGSNYYNIKKFNDKALEEKDKSDIIRSIVKLDGSDGSTDDGSCLKEILSGITSGQERRLNRGDEVKIIFEITDGASSLPGLAKESIGELLDKNVQIYGFQIGKNSKANEKVFNYVWNEGYEEPRGIVIGEQVETLPKELLKAVGKNMQFVFQG